MRKRLMDRVKGEFLRHMGENPKSKILILQCSKRNFADGLIQGFGNLDLGNLNLFRV